MAASEKQEPEKPEQRLAWVREGQLLRLRPEAEGAIQLQIGTGVFELTAASKVASASVWALRESGLWRGRGIDWGCGCGVLASLAARSADVEHIAGLDLEPANVQAALENAALNKLGDKTAFHVADSFDPLDGTKLATADFILANAPASSNNDGFEFRRRILREAPAFLKPGGYVMLQLISYYGPKRVREAVDAVPGMRYLGVCATTGWVPVKVRKQREVGAVASGTLLNQLQDYADEERRGGLRYHCHPKAPVTPPQELDDVEVIDPPVDVPREEDETYSAVETLNMVQEGVVAEPLCRWQCHLFQWVPAESP